MAPMAFIRASMRFLTFENPFAYGRVTYRHEKVRLVAGISDRRGGPRERGCVGAVEIGRHVSRVACTLAPVLTKSVAIHHFGVVLDRATRWRRKDQSVVPPAI